MALQRKYNELIDDFRSGNIDKRCFLDTINNLFFGGSGLEVQIMKKDGIATKWKDWFEVRDNDWWVENINQRRIAPCEFVADIDDIPEGQDRNEYVEKIVKELKWRCFDPLVFETGSKGFHLHSFDYEMMKVSDNERRMLQRATLKMLKLDPMKIAKRTLIALECTPHWKTGNLKQVWVNERRRETRE